MRTGSAVAAALITACIACTYDVPELASPDGSAGADDSGLQPDVVTSGDGAGEGGASEGGPAADATTGSDGPCTGPLCPCDNATSCASGVCALSLTVGAPLFAAAGHAFCTKPCCTSANCDAGTVCFGSGQGGNYCVDPAWLGRGPPGAAQGGATCSGHTDCRSGLCSNGLCADTCCSFPGAGECASGSQCSFGSFPGAASLDTHFTGRCALPGGSSAYGDPCSGNGQCAGGLCYEDGTGGNCTRPCGSSDECGGGNACQLDQQGSDLYFACFPSTSTSEQGANCSNNAQCRGYWCGAGNQCTNVCFSDTACTVVGWKCFPQPDSVGTGNYLVLACGKP